MKPTLDLMLCGDVMLGRGIDQVLPHPSAPALHEPWVTDATEYVRLAERVNGAIKRPVPYDYVWGDAIDELRRLGPDLRIINLETSITTADAYRRDKSIHYRMHPQNTPVIGAADIDCCVLANNHVLDWGRQGLLDTLDTLHNTGTATAGAGPHAEASAAPAVRPVNGRHVLVFAYALATSGVPRDWAAGPLTPGVNYLPDLSEGALHSVVDCIGRHATAGDRIVLSIHWGGNWGWAVPEDHVAFAHRLIDDAGVDIVHGHSSHHIKAVEVYHDRLIMYGCGDLLNDYEGIRGHEPYRPDLTLMYFPRIEASTGRLVYLRMTPMTVHRMRLCRPTDRGVAWLRRNLDRESGRFGVTVQADGRDLVVVPNAP